MSNRKASDQFDSQSKDSDVSELIDQAVVAERVFLAAELHDGISQQISAIRMGLESIALRAADEALAQDLHRWVQRLQDVGEDLRRTYRGLTPLVADKGLERALRELANDSAIPCKLVIDGDLDVLPLALQNVVFRICQECAHNIWRHAKAEHMRITLRSEDVMQLSIEDDGVGLSPHLVEERGNGIHNIRRRVAESGGTIEIGPGEDGGTVVSVCWG